MMSEKIDALDLIIRVLRDHELALDDSINRLEGVKVGKTRSSTSELLLSTVKEILFQFKESDGFDVKIRVNLSKNAFLDVDIAKRRKKPSKDDSLREDTLRPCPVVIA